MKSYCKKTDITNINFIKDSILECLDGKWKRHDTISLLFKFSDHKFSRKEIYRIICSREYDKIDYIINNISQYIKESIENENIVVPDITYSIRWDRNSKKNREISRENIIHQIYDYIAVNSISDLTNAKIGIYQCASIKNRGQSYARKHIEKWLHYDVENTKYFIKMDVVHFFQKRIT